MDSTEYQSERHRLRSEEARRKRVSFAAAYASLWRTRRRAGKDISGIQLMAAGIAGFGKNSWEANARYQTQRTLSTRLMRDQVVIDELLRQGMLRGQDGSWYDPILGPR